MNKTSEELASEYAKITASDIPGEERVIGENPFTKKAFLAGYAAAERQLKDMGIEIFFGDKRRNDSKN